MSQSSIKIISLKNYTSLLTKLQKPYLISDQSGQNLYTISGQKGLKTIPSGATHTYITSVREYGYKAIVTLHINTLYG